MSSQLQRALLDARARLSDLELTEQRSYLIGRVLEKEALKMRDEGRVPDEGSSRGKWRRFSLALAKRARAEHAELAKLEKTINDIAPGFWTRGDAPEESN